MTTPLLIHVDPSKPFVLKTYTFNFVVGTMLSQLGEDNLLHLVDLRFYKFFLVEINYKTLIKNF
jgi:hypothetical protein